MPSNCKWMLQLHKLDKKLLPPTIISKKGNYICYYTGKVGKGIVQIALYSKDNWKTLDYLTLYKPGKNKVTVLNVGGKAIDYETYKKYLNIAEKYGTKGLIKGIKELTKKKLSESSTVRINLNQILSSRTDRILYMLHKLVSSLVSVFTLFFILSFLVKWIRNISTEKSVSRLEEEINKKLYGNQTGKEPEFKVYSELINQILNVVNSESTNGMIVAGPPGTGKTYVIRRTLYLNKIKHTVLKGTSANIWSIYAELYRNRKGLLLLDDLDIPWTEDLVGILKAATDTQKSRPIYFPVATTETDQEGSTTEVPRAFVYEGKIIIVTNRDANKIPLPLKSRMPTIEVKFKTKEMLDIIHKMLKFMKPNVSLEHKEKVFNYILELYRKNKIKRIDFRIMILAIDLSIAYPTEWKKMILKYLV